ncbi:hypothetical protein BD770DRAFT_390215 [Pilaira anomala]|nr:hypothetical protein BD770DRAFT_390215 [Pilaira anomala]
MWSSLPKEILNLVVSHSGRDTKKVKWMFTNKKWFNFYLSQIYNTISIDLSTEDKKVDKILFSNFEVGIWVKKITFETFQPPDDIDKLDLTNDCLSMLIKHTPNVEEVQFAADKDLNDMIWTYFSTVLINTGYWKLRVLPEAVKNNLSYSAYYYLCAYYSRTTLRELYLSFAMVSSLNFRCLKEFKTLETLEIDINVINNLNDLYQLLQYTPNLKEATVKFGDNCFEMSQDQLKEYKVFSNLKKLTLVNFTPTLNKDLLAFTDQLSKVDNLKIIGEANKQWPGSEVASSVIDIFFDTINSLSEYKITIPGGAQGADFARKWLKSKTESNTEICLSISYDKNDIKQPEINSTVSTIIKSSKSSSVPVLQYQINHSDENSVEGVNILTNISDNVSQVEITGILYYNERTEMLLRAIVVKEKPSLRTLIIKNSTLYSYTSPNNTITVPQYVNCITFLNCMIYLDSFTSFLNEFEHLDYLKFDECKFQDFNDSGISIPHSTLGTVYFSNFRKTIASHGYSEDLQNVVIIDIYRLVPECRRYYTIIEDNITEITSSLFKTFDSKLNNDEIAVIQIKIKSFKELVFKLNDNSKEIKIHFPKCY